MGLKFNQRKAVLRAMIVRAVESFEFPVDHRAIDDLAEHYADSRFFETAIRNYMIVARIKPW